MFIRMVVLAAGLSGALAAAQFPAFSQQYMQRLGGAVAALDVVVADFDRSAATLGLSRSQALGQMTGSAFIERRRADMERTFDRHARLQADLAALEGYGPFMRAYRAAHLTDPEIAKGAWGAFEPALPLTFSSAIFACAGFIAASGLVSLLVAFLQPLRRRRRLPA